MSLIRRNPPPRQAQTLITLGQAAEILCLDESTLRKGKAGTENLTRVRQGTGQRRRMFFIREEVGAHVDTLIKHAREQNERPLNLIQVRK